MSEDAYGEYLEGLHQDGKITFEEARAAWRSNVTRRQAA
jgi:hypothetical protein